MGRLSAESRRSVGAARALDRSMTSAEQVGDEARGQVGGRRAGPGSPGHLLERGMGGEEGHGQDAGGAAPRRRRARRSRPRGRGSARGGRPRRSPSRSAPRAPRDRRRRGRGSRPPSSRPPWRGPAPRGRRPRGACRARSAPGGAGRRRRARAWSRGSAACARRSRRARSRSSVMRRSMWSRARKLSGTITRSTEECRCRARARGRRSRGRPARCARTQPGEAGDLLAAHGVALVGHGRRALLARPERLLDLAHLGLLQGADLGRELLEAGRR